jgi:hypothetical protein
MWLVGDPQNVTYIGIVEGGVDKVQMLIQLLQDGAESTPGITRLSI